jgi:hypothetical protein
MSKRGLAIITFNSEDYFNDLYKTVPFEKLDEIVVVNGGEKYKNIYDKVHWIQHEEVKYPSVARNDGLKYLFDKGVDHFFVCEDDMLIKDSNIFEKYENASKISGIQYFIYASISWGSGQKHNRTPTMKVGYSPVDEICLFPNMCNEFTYSSKKLIEEIGLYDEKLKYLFDVDFAYRVSQSSFGIPFWNFPDIKDSDDFIDNNPIAISRLDGNGERSKKLQPEYDFFLNKHKIRIQDIVNEPSSQVIEALKNIKNENKDNN